MNVENLALSCQGCNNHKYTKTTWHDPLTGEEVNLFNPRLQEWNDNFTWSADVTEILGTTVVGRATVDALKMNRPALQNLRSLLAEAGRHPPR